MTRIPQVPGQSLWASSEEVVESFCKSIRLWVSSAESELETGKSVSAGIPDWYQNCVRLLLRTQLKSIKRSWDPKVRKGFQVGFAIGLIRAALELLNTLPTPPSEGLEISDEETDRALNRFFQLLTGDEDFDASEEYSDENLKTKIGEIGFSVVFDSPFHETSGFARGLDRGLIALSTNPGGGAKPTTATGIYLALVVFAGLMPKIESTAHLHGILTAYFGRPVIGELKRVEQICRRINLRIRKPGRPPKKPSIAPPP